MEKQQMLPVDFFRSIESVAKIVGQLSSLGVQYGFNNQ
jgi:hypothetical protein